MSCQNNQDGRRIEQDKKRKMKNVVEKDMSALKRFIEDISQCMESFKKVAKFLDARKASTPASEWHESMKAANDILNSKDVVEVASSF